MAQADCVVVLGGAGFIGSRLVSILKDRVARIRVMGRKAGGLPPDGNVEYLAGDVCDGKRMMEVIEGATVVYQLTIEDDYEAGVNNVIAACLKHGARRLIYASTSDALYLGDGGIIYETDPPDVRPELRNSYSRGKAKAERILRDAMKNTGLGVVIVRPCLVVGPGGRLQHGGIGRWSSPTCCHSWGDGENPMPWVLVQDVCEALALALDAPGIEGETFNLSGDVFLSTRKYIEIVRERTKRNFRMKPTNLLLFYLRGRLKNTMIRIATGKAPDVESFRELRSSGMFTHIDNSRSKKLLGWRPNDSLDVFIREAIDIHIPAFPKGDLRLGGRPTAES